MASKANLDGLHKKARHHRTALAKSKICGCFYCLKEFPFEQIAEWIDENDTALCPYCGVDAVLGFATSAADQELLHQMHEHWFRQTRRLTPEEWTQSVEGDKWVPAELAQPHKK